ncbi:MAG TPA: DMT family transporter [Thermodesulfobacteriota bacterium]|nr:DMT family transporter [Thermodesulfobacteriota bacterium]
MALNIFLLLFVVITWAYSWVLMKIGLQFMEPFTFATLRCAIGTLGILPLLYMKRISMPKGEKWFDYLVIGLFQTTGMFGFMLYGMKFVTAGKAAVLLYTMSLWTSLLAHFYLKEKLSALRWLGIISGIIGVLCILGWDTLVNQNAKILFGEFLIIMGAVSWAIANIWDKKRMMNEDTYMVNGLQMLIGTVGLALIAFPTEGLGHVRWTWVSISILIFTGIVASSIDFTLWFYLLRKLDTFTVAFSVMLVPVFGLFLDWLQLGSKLDTGIIIGGGFILIGIYLETKHQKSKLK